MSTKRLWASIIVYLAVVGGLFAFGLTSGHTPVLGLDLRGGVSVILAPADEGVAAEDLTIIRDMVRDQLEATGIAEPDVRVEGENVIVDLPGVNDQQEALSKVSVSGIVHLRPVVACGPETVANENAGQVVLPYLDGPPCVVGPAGASGEVFERKSAGVDLDEMGRWIVTVDLTSGGEAQWNELATQCYTGASTCPSTQLAIVLDDVIQSAPVVQTPTFDDSVQISGSFTEDQARSLAEVLNRGAFPFQMTQERVETVSPTAGQSSLNAAIIAGLIGAGVMLVAMVVYYRKLSVVMVLGLLVWAMTAFAFASLVSRWTNYALTLAGVTGIIVATGIAIDSYVVLFERLREEVRHGRTVRNAAPRSFQATWGTIVAANVVSLMSAVVLFWLSVGSVKGFALYLGLTTVCGLLVAYFFNRPAVILLARTKWMEGDRAGARATGDDDADPNARPGADVDAPVPVATSAWGRLIDSQTAIDFIGLQKLSAILSCTLLAATVVSLSTQGLNLGIDFEGGVSWDVPAAELTIADAEEILADHGLGDENARIQERESDARRFIKVQVASQPEAVGSELRSVFADAAGVELEEVDVNLVSSSWGSEITRKAVQALAIFVLLVTVFIAIKFEWRMAVAAIASMIHDVVIAVGIYSIFQFLVTPPTVIAFLTILGYSLYDTIVVFDRVRENEARFAAHRVPYDDVINVSMNQVLMRSLATSFSSVVPVVSMLLIGAGLMGQSTLSEFSLALLIGMVTGVYSSLVVAGPLLGFLKRRDPSWEARQVPRAVGPALRDMVMGVGTVSRRTREDAAVRGNAHVRRQDADGEATEPVPVGAPTASDASSALQHAPRPRKKKRR